MQNDDLDVLKDAITNVLTPGLQDGKNDLFGPVENLREKGFEVDKSAASLTIFNHWDGVMHFAGKPPFTWDGKVGGQPVPQATYYFVLKTGVGEPFKGSVTVLR